MAAAMAANSVLAPHFPYKRALPLRHILPDALELLRRSRTYPRAMSACFGSLSDRDGMVVKGLAASQSRQSAYSSTIPGRR
jgi:hypothetical protein